MKSLFKAVSALALSGFVLTGCATNGYEGGYASQGRHYDQGSERASYVSGYGVVDSIEAVDAHQRPSGLGVVAGGLIGGLLGNQVGSGGGRSVATVAGAVGGAMVGNHLEDQNGNHQAVYKIGVRMDQGGYQAITQDSALNLSVGARVKVENGRVTGY